MIDVMPYMQSVVEPFLKSHIKPQDRDDCRQEGYRGLVEAAQRYNASHASGATFTTYARWFVRRFAWDFIRRKRMIWTPRNVPQFTRHWPDDIPGGECLAWSEVQEALDMLNERSRYVLTERYLHGKNLTEIGQALGMTKQSAHAVCGNALEEMRRLLGVEPRELSRSKVCFQCGRDKPLELFCRHSHGKFGRYHICKSCRKKKP